jgi:hypothetical protein
MTTEDYYRPLQHACDLLLGVVDVRDPQPDIEVELVDAVA